MKIGELFVALGFRVDDQPLEQVDRSMERAAVKAGKLALYVNAANVAILALVDSATKAAVAIRLWEQTTGGDGETLQRWSAAARLAGITANDLRGAVDALNDARASFARGDPQAVGAWSILGVNPTQDPFAVLTGLRKRMADVKDPNLMRSLLGQVGLAGAMPLLQLPEAEFARMKEINVLTRREVDSLVQLNREWQRLLVTVQTVGQKMAAALAPSLRSLAELLQATVQRFAQFFDWLNGSSNEARILRSAIGFLAISLLALGAALGVVTVAFGALFLATSPFVAMLALVSAGVLALALMLDDLYTAAEGGKSVFDWGDAKTKVEALTAAMGGLLSVVNGITLAWKEFVGLVSKPGQFLKDFNTIVGGDFALRQQLRENQGAAWFTPRALAAQRAANNVENNVEINVDGARSPAETADAVNRTLRRELEGAAYQAPVPNF